MLTGPKPEEVERTLHPTVSLESITHLRRYGYFVMVPADLLAMLTAEIEAGRYGKDSASIARRIVNLIRRGS